MLVKCTKSPIYNFYIINTMVKVTSNATLRTRRQYTKIILQNS